ncbi:unnamed protein product, partial [Amoebophrya sp. A25]|eukprot:GSA25T00002670001.1
MSSSGHPYSSWGPQHQPEKQVLYSRTQPANAEIIASSRTGRELRGENLPQMMDPVYGGEFSR